MHRVHPLPVGPARSSWALPWVLQLLVLPAAGPRHCRPVRFHGNRYPSPQSAELPSQIPLDYHLMDNNIVRGGYLQTGYGRDSCRETLCPDTLACRTQSFPLLSHLLTYGWHSLVRYQDPAIHSKA
ncbi:hypothetical protein SCFA_1220003 [anaerobic digester metagenome]|uniref:Uncharacterized protein n=1 Tax=anaerobic digester metagenome TaxID=1263854 RepID=A0A485LV35_9ZZZZ